MKFTKIYIEITNICNLNCSFCSKDNRPLKEMTEEEFTHILKQIRHYTKTIYLHVKGEPLLHSKLDKLLTLAEKYQLNVRLTTNGTLLEKNYQTLLKHNNIKQINISLHAEHNSKNYYEKVFNIANKLSTKIPIVYRIWLLNNYQLDKLSTEIVDKIINYYQLPKVFHQKVEKENNIKIVDNIYLDKDNAFTWPDDVKDKKENTGTCLATRTHIAILVNGDVVPCCLDSKSLLKLGNIFEDSLDDILNSKLFKELNSNFQKHILIANLCKNCSFQKLKFK